METIPNETYYTAILPAIIGAIPVLYIALSLLWNRKWLPRQRQRGKATPTFGNLIGRIIKFAFFEDPQKLLPKVKNKFTDKFLTLKTINVALIIVTLALLGLKNADAWIPAVILILAVWIRTAPILNKRDAILDRMFAVASSVFRYERGAEFNPWAFVMIKKWEALTVPGETHVKIPARWDGSNSMSRDGFERHFNGTVTDENSWIYTWESAKGLVIARPITHLPNMADYPGSEQHPWSTIPLGLGAEGEVTVDLTKTPHALICGTTGSGKSLELKTTVWTKAGKREIGSLVVGDILFDPNGNETRVTHLHPIVTPQKAYEITFKNGEKLIVDEEHLWETETRNARVSRFNHVKKEDSRTRSYLFSDDMVEKIKAELALTTNSDTISIPEIAELTDKPATSGLFFDIAKEVGVAEVITPITKFNYGAQIVKQKQKLTYVNKNEFIANYNARRAVTPTKNFPLTRSHFDKLNDLAREIRDTDVMTVDSVVEFMNASTPTTVKWINDNFNASLNSLHAVKDLAEKAKGKYSPFPDKIFEIQDLEYVNIHDFASLLNIDMDIAKPTFHTVKAKSTDVFKKEVELELVVAEKVVERNGNPYNTYPKGLFLERLLTHNELPSYDQQDKREFVSIKETGELFNTLWSDDNKTHKNHTIRRAKTLVLDEAELPIAPYVLGAWLGDGYSAKGEICGEDAQVFDYIESLGYESTSLTRNREVVKKGIEKHNSNFRVVKFPRLHSELKLAELSSPNGHRVRLDGDVKHIPLEYLMSSEEQRRELLRGLLDTDGSVAYSGGIEFYTSIPQLRDDVKFLVSSLGYIPFTRSKIPSYMSQGIKKQGKEAYTVAFQAPPADRLFNLDRKNKVHAERFTGERFDNSYADAHLIVDIQEITPVPMRCISVDSPDRLFAVSDSMILTHNSVLQRNLIFHCIQHNDMWRFLGVDVKRVELTPFKRYSKTILGIGANLEDGVEIVRYAKEVMETRYQEMEERGVNHFKDLLDPVTGKPPYAIMLMIDEAFMFMSPEGAKTDEGKMRDELHGEASTILGDIARLGRASGVHLVLATQRPDATVIKGELKANLDIRVAAGRLDSTPSSMVLDSGAATQLPGHIKGRGIVRFSGEQQQFQGYFAPQSWIEDWLKAHPGVEPDLYPLESAEKSADDVDSELEALAEEYDFEDGVAGGEKTEVGDDALTVADLLAGANDDDDDVSVDAPVSNLSMTKPPVVEDDEEQPVSQFSMAKEPVSVVEFDEDEKPVSSLSAEKPVRVEKVAEPVTSVYVAPVVENEEEQPVSSLSAEKPQKRRVSVEAPVTPAASVSGFDFDEEPVSKLKAPDASDRPARPTRPVSAPPVRVVEVELPIDDVEDDSIVSKPVVPAFVKKPLPPLPKLPPLPPRG
jgi:intein/homing endonuclease